MHSFLQHFGFGEKSGIDLSGEKPGLLPSKEWKRHQHNQSWYPGETLITGIGQGYLQVSPIQLAKATATLANKGKVVTPFLVKNTISTDESEPVIATPPDDIAIKPENINTVVSAMINVIHDPHGTAKGISKNINYQIAGKTGTAQVFNIKQDAKYNENDIDFKLRDHALFISFAPADDPKIAVAVIVENGGHGGSVAAPIAGQVIKQYLEDHNEIRNP
jgi:penicillin-binding protein 2